VASVSAAACVAPPADAPPDADLPAARDPTGGDGQRGVVDVPAPSPALCAGALVGDACAVCGAVSCSDDGPQCDPGAEQCRMFEAVPLAGPVGGGGLQFGSGIAFGDIDGDGRVDAAVGSRSRVLVYFGGDGGMTRDDNALTAPSPANVGAVNLVDTDGDGDLDLFLTSRDPTPGLHLLLNDGGRFYSANDVLSLPAMERPFGAAWGDVDGDGWLDVFVAGYFKSPSVLLRNLGGAGFEDITHWIDIDTTHQASLQPVWIDVDADGDLDLFVANDFGPASGWPSALYRNDGGALTYVSADAGFDDLIYGMGIGVADIDADGDLDLYVTNIGWAAGGQKLYLNQGDGTFVEGAREVGASADDRWGWGVAPVDVDNDGDIDLALAGEYPSAGWVGERDGERFLDVTHVAGEWPTGDTLYGLASADIDGDGRVDLGWNPLDETSGARIYRNVHPSTGHWVTVALSAPPPNTRAIGATVIVSAGGKRRAAAILAGNSYLSSDEPVAHVGLGDADAVESIEVRWPGGEVVAYPGPFDVDRVIVLAR